jgi:hypothetical protein
MFFVGAGGSPYKMTDQGGFFSQWTAPMGRKSHCVVGTSLIAFAIVEDERKNTE